MLPRENGKPVDRHAGTRYLNKAAAAGLPHLHPHKLRHTLATQAINRPTAGAARRRGRPEDGPAAPRTPPGARQRLQHPGARARLRLRGQSRVGEVLAVVECRIDEVVHNPNYDPRNGEAAFLPGGTVLREVVGYRHGFRLAAFEEGAWRIYEPSQVPGAETGEDLLDIRGKVERIHSIEGERGEAVLRTVEDEATVQAVTDAVLDAPVLTGRARYESMGKETPVFIRFDPGRRHHRAAALARSRPGPRRQHPGPASPDRSAHPASVTAVQQPWRSDLHRTEDGVAAARLRIYLSWLPPLCCP